MKCKMNIKDFLIKKLTAHGNNFYACTTQEIQRKNFPLNFFQIIHVAYEINFN